MHTHLRISDLALTKLLRLRTKSGTGRTRGTGGSNPVPSSGESGANSTPVRAGDQDSVKEGDPDHVAIRAACGAGTKGIGYCVRADKATRDKGQVDRSPKASRTARQARLAMPNAIRITAILPASLICSPRRAVETIAMMSGAMPGANG